MPAETPSGKVITCDGCGSPVERVTESMRHPVPAGIALKNYGTDNRDGSLVYIVCAPLPDGTRPCLALAELAEELYDRCRCRVLGCDGTRCGGEQAGRG